MLSTTLRWQWWAYVENSAFKSKIPLSKLYIKKKKGISVQAALTFCNCIPQCQSIETSWCFQDSLSQRYNAVTPFSEASEWIITSSFIIMFCLLSMLRDDSDKPGRRLDKGEYSWQIPSIRKAAAWELRCCRSEGEGEVRKPLWNAVRLIRRSSSHRRKLPSTFAPENK